MKPSRTRWALARPRRRRFALVSRGSGFTLIELAIVLAVAAVLTMAGVGWISSLHSSGSSVAAQSTSDAARAALASFARTNHRLPCPDITGNGLEGDCSDLQTRIGWLPLVTLGMSDRKLEADTLRRPRYAVYRAPGMDLVRPQTALAVTPPQALSFALSAVAIAAVDITQPVVARVDTDCSAAPSNVAFVVQVPVESTTWRPADAATLCFVSTQPMASETAARLLAEVTRS